MRMWAVLAARPRSTGTSLSRAGSARRAGKKTALAAPGNAAPGLLGTLFSRQAPPRCITQIAAQCERRRALSGASRLASAAAAHAANTKALPRPAAASAAAAAAAPHAAPATLSRGQSAGRDAPRCARRSSAGASSCGASAPASAAGAKSAYATASCPAQLIGLPAARAPAQACAAEQRQALACRGAPRGRRGRRVRRRRAQQRRGQTMKCDRLCPQHKEPDLVPAVREPLPLSAGAMQRTGNDNEQGAQRGGRGHGVGHAGKVQRRVRSERARAHAARAAQQRGRGQQRRRVQQDGRAR
jgi:hypothetical protein